jgi:hypothetical protein
MIFLFAFLTTRLVALLLCRACLAHQLTRMLRLRHRLAYGEIARRCRALAKKKTVQVRGSEKHRVMV